MYIYIYDKKFVLGSLEHLNIYYMRNLRSIWEGSFVCVSLSSQKVVVHFSKLPFLSVREHHRVLTHLFEGEEQVVLLE